jgi:DNA-binding SARP family transcriptional activator
MRALALSGQRSAALSQYLACQRLLEQELGVEPASETTALYEAIREGELIGAVGLDLHFINSWGMIRPS